MPRVSIGVPVYNGASLIGECLDCLAGQTYGDFEVLISDNASTDGTSEICAAFCEKDRRFRHVVHAATIDMMANFLAARDATAGPLFMWRAFDDLAEPDYLERLVGLHDRKPGLRLAVGSVRQEFGGARPDRLIRYPANDRGLAALRILAQLFRGEAAWFYGLWSREAVGEALAAVGALYPDAWGADHLSLFHAAVRDGIRGDAAAVFRQRIIASARNYVPRQKPDFAEMTGRNARFRDTAQRLLDTAPIDATAARLVRATLPVYVNRRCHRMLRLAQAWARRYRGR